MRRQHDFLKFRQLESDRAIGIDRKRGAVEYQLVLAADLIQINQRQAGLDHAAERDVEPFLGFAAPIGRAVRHQEDFAAGFGQALDHFGAPDILADRYPDASALDHNRTGQRAGRENPFFVEHAVIRQIDLEADCLDPAAGEKGVRIVELAVLKPRRADEHGWAAIAGVARQRFDRGAAGRLKRRLEHQVFRRIAGDEQFGKGDDIGALARRLRARDAGALEIAGDVADNRIELRQRDGQPIGGTLVHGNDLTPDRTAPDNAKTEDRQYNQRRLIRRLSSFPD